MNSKRQGRSELSNKEQLTLKKEVCETYIATVKSQVLEHLEVILERTYRTAFEAGYSYRKMEEIVRQSEMKQVL